MGCAIGGGNYVQDGIGYGHNHRYGHRYQPYHQQQAPTLAPMSQQSFQPTQPILEGSISLDIRFIRNSNNRYNNNALKIRHNWILL